MKKRILIVDDEAAFGRIVKLNLEETGRYEVVTETKGPQALAVARKFKPDLILMDIVMPDLDGGDACREIKSDPVLKNIPIVFLTAIVTEREAVSQKSVMGGYPLLAKPIAVEKLIDCIEKNTTRS